MYPADVQLVRWPEGQDDRRRLSDTGQLCLLVIEANIPPPSDLQPGEDWVRSTADPIEVRSRIDRLRAANASRLLRPTLDDDGILAYADRWVALSPGDVPIGRVLCERFNSLVTRDELRVCFEPPCTDATLAVKLYRLRRHLAGLGLRLTTIRGRGCVLERAERSPGAGETEPEARRPTSNGGTRMRS